MVSSNQTHIFSKDLLQRTCSPRLWRFERYLSVQSRMSHWLSESETDSLDGSYCFWNHDGEPLLPSVADRGSNGGNGRLISRPQS